MSDLISVIVPIYKAEQYLRPCVDSIVNQTYKNLEIILVNDGSPDNCLAICKEYVAKDRRVVLLNRSNGGQSVARNTGLDVARGDYIAFVDADDMIEPRMYEILLNQIKEYSADISQCGVTSDNSFLQKEINTADLNDDLFIVDWRQAITELLDSGPMFNCAVWNKLYRRSIFDAIRFTDVRGEDFIINYQILKKKHPKIVSNSIPMYHYIQRSLSITTGKLDNSNFSFLNMLDKMEAEETDLELLEHWKIQKAISSRNILIRQIVSGDFPEYIPNLRRNMSNAEFIIWDPKYSYINKSLKLHIILQSISFDIYRAIIKRTVRKKQ